MKRFYAKRKNYCAGTSSGISKAVFFIGALNKLMQSTLVVAICAALGFILGVGSTIITVKLHASGSNRDECLNSIIKLVEKRQELDMEIEDKVRSVIRNETAEGGPDVPGQRSTHRK